LGLPLTLRSGLFALYGKKVYGTFGDIVDMLAVVTTMFAVVANMGVVATQIVAGLVYLKIVPEQDGIVGQVSPSPAHFVHRGCYIFHLLTCLVQPQKNDYSAF
jgi:hypothetical protein